MQEKAPDCPSWWLLNALTESLACTVNTVVQRLQSRRITLSQQATEMEYLSASLIATIGTTGPLSDEAAATIDSDMYVVRDLWCAE